MDTSVYETAHLILGHNRIPHQNVPPEAWIEVIEEIYLNDIVHDSPGIFRQIGDLTNGNHRPINTIVPRGLTIFPQGFGINTRVHLSTLFEEDHGKAVLPDTPNLREYREGGYLILVKPEKHRIPPAWATWVLQSTLSVKREGKESSDYRRTATRSRMHPLDRAGVIEIFAQYPRAPLAYLDIGVHLELRAYEMRDQAHELGKLASWIQSVNQRVEK